MSAFNNPGTLFVRRGMITLVAIVALQASVVAGRYYVDASTGNNSNNGLSPGTPFKTITHAMSVAVSSDTIIVAAGTYDTGLGEVFPIEMVSGVALISADGPFSTSIDATGSMKRVMNISGASTATLLRGFTITGGESTELSNGSNSVGGGLHISGGSEAVIEGNMIVGNTARGYDFNEVTNGHNGGNAYGGGIYVSSAAPIIRNNVIGYNTVTGGGGENWQGGFSGTPSAGGFAVGGGIAAAFSQAVVINNTFYANQAIGGPGGTTNNGTDPQADGGTASAGGLDAGFNVIAFNNIFAANFVLEGPKGGGGVSGNPEAATNGAVSAAQASQLSYNLYYANVAAVSPDGAVLGTTGNVFGDPLFVSVIDLHLSTVSSPAYHAGTPTGAPTRDLDGTLRGNPPSIGAYEGLPTTSISRQDPASIPGVFSLSQNYPNPFNPTTTIPYTIEADGPVRLTVHDLLGREVTTLVNRVQQAAVRHEVRFDASRLSSGVYFLRLVSGGKSALRRITLLK